MSRYDPLRNALACASAPSAAHKYDMVRGLLRGSGSSSGSGAAEQSRKYDLIFDLLKSLRTSGEYLCARGSRTPVLQPRRPRFRLLSARDTSWVCWRAPAMTRACACRLRAGARRPHTGEPAAIMASGDPKYDPVWCLLNMREPARGSLSKYDLVSVAAEERRSRVAAGH